MKRKRVQKHRKTRKTGKTTRKRHRKTENARKNRKRKTRKRKRRNPISVIEIVPPNFRAIVKKICQHHHGIDRVRESSQSSNEEQRSSDRHVETRSCVKCHRKWYTVKKRGRHCSRSCVTQNHTSGRHREGPDTSNHESYPSTSKQEPSSFGNEKTDHLSNSSSSSSGEEIGAIQSNDQQLPPCRRASRCPESFDIAHCHQERTQSRKRSNRGSSHSSSSSSSPRRKKRRKSSSGQRRNMRSTSTSRAAGARPTATQSDMSHVAQEVVDVMAGKKKNPTTQNRGDKPVYYCRCQRCGNRHKVLSTKEHHHIHTGHMAHAARKKHGNRRCKLCGRSSNSRKSIKIVITP